MASEDANFDMSDGFGLQRPSFHIGYHNSNNNEPLTDLQYGHLLNHGVSRK
jgi:protein arginine N-methyltransferase 5